MAVLTVTPSLKTTILTATTKENERGNMPWLAKKAVTSPTHPATHSLTHPSTHQPSYPLTHSPIHTPTQGMLCQSAHACLPACTLPGHHLLPTTVHAFRNYIMPPTSCTCLSQLRPALTCTLHDPTCNCLYRVCIIIPAVLVVLFDRRVHLRDQLLAVLHLCL